MSSLRQWLRLLLVRSYAIYRRSDPEPTEALLGGMHFIYGGWFLAPWDTLGSHPVGNSGVHGYHYTELIFRTEIGIGLAACVIGFLQLAGGVMGMSLALRRAVSLLATAYWALVTAGFLEWNWQSTANPVYGGLAIAHLWVALRLSAEARQHGVLGSLIRGKQ